MSIFSISSCPSQLETTLSTCKKKVDFFGTSFGRWFKELKVLKLMEEHFLNKSTRFRILLQFVDQFYWRSHPIEFLGGADMPLSNVTFFPCFDPELQSIKKCINYFGKQLRNSHRIWKSIIKFFTS